MYTISETALRQYRNGAKRDVNLPKNILEIKINCLIMSVDAINTRYTTCGKIFQFGKCQFEVDRNMNVRKISWCDCNTVLRPEITRLKSNYKKYGLNSAGNAFVSRL